jgi:DNA-binding response OmpR family regulator
MKKILFIDDEKDMFPLVLKIFPKEKYRIVCAADGAEGMFKARNEDFDLIITDFRMPKVDGFKFFQQLRDNEELRKKDVTPVLFVSAWADEVRAKRTNWHQCDFLNKPYQVYELTQKSQKLLGEITETQSPRKSESKILLAQGEMLFDEGDTGKEVFYLSSGKLASYKKTASREFKLVGYIYPGELVGEMAAIDDSPRACKIVAEEASELISIPSEKLLTLIHGQPKWIRLMIENLSTRLRETLKKVS